jgi:hypothetical protein
VLNSLYEKALLNKDTTVMKVAFDASIIVFGRVLLMEKSTPDIDKIAVEQFARTLSIANNVIALSIKLYSDEIMVQELLIRSVFGKVSKSQNPKISDIRKLLRSSELLLSSILKSMSLSSSVFNIDFDRFYSIAGEAVIDIRTNSKSKLQPRDLANIDKVIENLILLNAASLNTIFINQQRLHTAQTNSEKLSIIGIYAASLNDSENSLLIANSLFNGANRALRAANSLQSVEMIALELVKNALFIGAVSHKNRQFAASREIKDLAQNFEDSWLAKIFPDGFKPDVNYMPPPRATRYCLSDVFENNNMEYGTLPDLFETPQSRMLQIIEEDDVETYYHYVWDDKPEPEPISDDEAQSQTPPARLPE